MRGLLGVLPALIAAACVTPQPPDYRPVADRISGLPITTIVASLGPPTQQTVVSGEQWHVWTTQHFRDYGPSAGIADFYCRLSVREEALVATDVRIQGNRGGCTPLLRPFLGGMTP